MATLPSSGPIRLPEDSESSSHIINANHDDVMNTLHQSSQDTSSLGAGIPIHQARVNKYETNLPMRINVEAAMTYILGFVTGILFLILERKNAYVRFHAWQSTLLFSSLYVMQLIFRFFKSSIAWYLFALEVALAAYLAWQAYKGADHLDRAQVPFFGRIASEWADRS